MLSYSLPSQIHSWWHWHPNDPEEHGARVVFPETAKKHQVVLPALYDHIQTASARGRSSWPAIYSVSTPPPPSWTSSFWDSLGPSFNWWSYLQTTNLVVVCNKVGIMDGMEWKRKVALPVIPMTCTYFTYFLHMRHSLYQSGNNGAVANE